MALTPLIEWQAPEHHYIEKNKEWYIAFGIIALTATIIALYFANYIFAILIIISFITLSLQANRKPEVQNISINDRGLVIDNTLYPFLHLRSFWIDDTHTPPRLIIKSRKTFTPLISIIIEEVDDEDVRQIMLKYISEIEHPEPLGKKILENFGI